MPMTFWISTESFRIWSMSGTKAGTRETDSRWLPYHGSNSRRRSESCGVERLAREAAVRTHLVVSGVAAAATAAVLLRFGTAPRASQSQAAADTARAVAPSGPGVKTAWGDPDLEGIWAVE